MSNVTKPIILDETGQAIKSAIKEGASIIIDRITGSGGRAHPIYGFHIDSAEADPGKAVTYLKDAVGMTPAKMNYLNNKFSYGSWIDAFFMPRPCMVRYDGTVDYYLDPNDYDKKENGELSDIGDPTTDYGVTYPGNAMMEWGTNDQQIWTKVVPDTNNPTSGSVYISNVKVDDDYTAWPFVNNQGTLTKHFYTAIYNGSVTAYKNNSNTYYRLRSIPRRPVMNSSSPNSNIPWDDGTSDTLPSISQTGGDNEIRFSLNNNASINLATTDSISNLSSIRQYVGWFTEVFCDIQLINNLLILMGKNLNTQDVFGNGNINSYSQSVIANNILYTGSHQVVDNEQNYSVLNKAGFFWGSTSSRQAVKVFGMENWWGNQFRRYAGHIVKSSKHFIKNTFGTEDGSSAVGYNLDGTNYIDTLCTIPSSNNYIRACKFIKMSGLKASCLLPGLKTESDPPTPSSSTYYCDYFYTSSGGSTYALRGGRNSNEAQCGAFMLTVSADYTGTGVSRGSSISFKPFS